MRSISTTFSELGNMNAEIYYEHVKANKPKDNSEVFIILCSDVEWIDWHWF